MRIATRPLALLTPAFAPLALACSLATACAGSSRSEIGSAGADPRVPLGSDVPRGGLARRWVLLRGEAVRLEPDVARRILGEPNADGGLWIRAATPEIRDEIREAGEASGEAPVPLGTRLVPEKGEGRLGAMDFLAQVGDFDVEIRSWEAVPDPVVHRTTGVALSLRPELSSSGDSVWLHAELELSEKLPRLVVPSSELDLGTPQGYEDPDSIRLPVTRTTGLRTRRPVAVGDALLLGGIPTGADGKMAFVMASAREGEPPDEDDR